MSRELLELAAKAAGIKVVRSRLDDPMNQDMLVEDSPRNPGQASGSWNPLTDDGDAFRLAVKLRISPLFGGYATEGEGWAQADYPNPRNRYTTIKGHAQVPYVPEEMFHNPRDAKYAAYLMEGGEGEYVRGLEAATRRAIVRAAAEIGKAMP